MNAMKRNELISLIFIASIFVFASCGGGGKSEDGAEDGNLPDEADAADRDGPGPEAPPETADVPADDIAPEQQEEDAPADTQADQGEGDAQADPEEDAEAEVEPAAVCGNSIVEAGEACDDGNTATEACGGGTDCVGDCSMLEETCGNGTHEAGEACDDGDTDSMNACTTSCTANDHGIGAPCTCTGGRCSDTDFTAGTINGCSGVTVPPGTGGVLGCLRSIHESTSGTDTYYAEGYCTIMAVTCSGALCVFVPKPGDFDTIACPAGTYLYEDSRTVMGSTTVTSRSCLKTCTSDADCRWNAYDSFRSACGAYMCLPAPADPSVSVCSDPRMLAP
jgi:hypothetical protein